MLDVDHVLFWMDAIRNSNDQYRTLESFWKGQIKSKLWLIDNIIPYASSNNNKIVIHGGWHGVLASLLFQSDIKISKIVSIDIDPMCEKTARTMNKIEEMEGKFQTITSKMEEYEYDFPPDIVINTSCEHVTQDVYNKWLLKIPNQSVIVLQSNNYYELDEHIRCAKDIDEFKEQSKIKTYLSLKLDLPKYSRFMLIGKKEDV